MANEETKRLRYFLMKAIQANSGLDHVVHHGDDGGLDGFLEGEVVAVTNQYLMQLIDVLLSFSEKNSIETVINTVIIGLVINFGDVSTFEGHERLENLLVHITELLEKGYVDLNEIDTLFSGED